MAQPSKILASNWNNGVFVLDNDGLVHELPNHSVRGLSDDLEGGAFAAVDGHSLFQRDGQGDWNRVATSEFTLSVTFAVDDKVYVGTDDARVLILDERGNLVQIDCFESIEGRDSWLAGTAIIDGQEVGPPLGVRSLSGAANGCLFANVHVGGIPRSADAGATWTPTIDVNLDAHEVRVSPTNRNLVAAATAAGLCMSHDGGSSWSIHTDGRHAPYCSAVAISREHIFVAASESHFSQEGAIYRRGIEPSSEPLEKVGAGLPNWLGGIVDTSCIASSEEDMALISATGDVYVSTNAGLNWHKREENIASVSSVLIVR